MELVGHHVGVTPSLSTESVSKRIRIGGVYFLGQIMVN